MPEASGKCESLASKIDEVSRNQIWREQLKKEYLMEAPVTAFQLNPKTLSAITLKPTQVHPKDFSHGSNEQDPMGIIQRMKDVNKKPNEKANLPLTEAQRVGWYHDAALQGIRAEMQRRMMKPKGSSDVTQFADHYCTMAGCSPFADKSTR